MRPFGTASPMVRASRDIGPAERGVTMLAEAEPGLTIAPDRIMVHEENLVVHAGGAGLLTRRAPPDLAVV